MKTDATDRSRHSSPSPSVERAKPAAPAPTEQEVTLDRRAQRNLSNLTGASNFSSPNLPAVGGVASKQSTGAIDEQRGYDAWNKVEEIKQGLFERTTAVQSVELRVQEAEATLAQHLTHLEGSLTQEQLQAYADDYRRDNPVYAEARATAEELASYLAESVGPLAQAEADIAAFHPYPTMYRPGDVKAQLDQTVRALDLHISGSSTGSAALGDTLTTISLAATAGGAVASGLADLAPGLKTLASRAGTAFGLVGGLADTASALGRIASGDGRTEHYVGAAAGAVAIAKVAGVAVSAPVSVIATAVGLVATGVSAYRDNEERVADMSARLSELGLSADQSEALARSNPAAIKALSEAGYSPEHIQRLAEVMATPSMLSVHPSDAQFFDRVMRDFGRSPEEAVQMLEQLGDELAARSAWALSRVGGLGGKTTEDHLLEVRSGWGIADDLRGVLLEALGG